MSAVEAVEGIEVREVQRYSSVSFASQSPSKGLPARTGKDDRGRAAPASRAIQHPWSATPVPPSPPLNQPTTAAAHSHRAKEGSIDLRAHESVGGSACTGR